MKRRQHHSGGAISHMVGTAITRVTNDVEPMEAEPPKDQEEQMEMDPPPAWLPCHHHIMPGFHRGTTGAPGQQPPVRTASTHNNPQKMAALQKDKLA
ncbi:hypothetical protein WISP_67877 [Willisornis vidua]|uniref:Uncharacterized protein n=1 Tax=Willisornis vidua TaxID=1566151 RepID=A0ABQ9DEG2_9PASS|nr:hypothetical protein WISP_67877 [Willisornis vidua]